MNERQLNGLLGAIADTNYAPAREAIILEFRIKDELIASLRQACAGYEDLLEALRDVRNFLDSEKKDDKYDDGISCGPISCEDVARSSKAFYDALRSIEPEDEIVPCMTCGKPMQLVRPGKWQCVNEDCEDCR
jgi:hypothetical protein